MEAFKLMYILKQKNIAEFIERKYSSRKMLNLYNKRANIFTFSITDITVWFIHPATEKQFVAMAAVHL